MNDDTARQRRVYRFGELRGAGLFGALPISLVVPVGVAAVAVWAALAGFVPVPVAVPAVVVGLVVACGRVRGQALHALLPALAGFWGRRLTGRHRWCRPVPLLSDDGIPVAVPPALAGLDLYEVEVDWVMAGRRDPLGVVHDRAAGTVSGVVRVSGDGQFALLDDREQESRADGWGGALAGFARDRARVVRVKWDDWAAPVPVQEQIGTLQARWADEPTSTPRDSYLRLLGVVAPDVVRHELLLTVTVDLPRRAGRRRRRPARSGLETAVASLGEELRLFRDRLDAARVQVAGVLSAAELVVATRVRADPAAGELLAGLRQSLASATGWAAPNFGPLVVREELGLVRVDRAVHRSWWFARWPRREVADAGWLGTLIDGPDCTRTVSVVFEPIRPSQSDRAVEREVTKREANMESRRRRDFRVSGKDRKALDEAEAREAELNAGFVEMFYVGLVTLTAGDDATLEAHAGELEQTAAQAGIELQPLWGQQAAGWVAALPLGRALATRTTP